MSRLNNTVVEFAEMVLTRGALTPTHVAWLNERVPSVELRDNLLASAELNMLGTDKDPEMFILHLLEMCRDRHAPTAPIYELVQRMNSQFRAKKKRQLKFTNYNLLPQQAKAMGLTA